MILCRLEKRTLWLFPNPSGIVFGFNAQFLCISEHLLLSLPNSIMLFFSSFDKVKHVHRFYYVGYDLNVSSPRYKWLGL